MKINIKNFKDVVTKSTLNFGIETLQLRFGDRIKSDMINNSGTSIAIMNLENNVLNTNEELILNFVDPSVNLIPFLSLYDNDEIELSINDVFIKLKDRSQITKISLSAESAIKRLGTDSVKDVEWFYDLKIDEEIINKFSKIKKIGARFRKIYFTVDNKKLYLETTDKTNRYGNGVKFQLDNIDKDDLVLAYSYNDVVNFFHCIEMSMEKNFNLKFAWDDEQELGCIYAHSENNDEKYSLISRENL